MSSSASSKLPPAVSEHPVVLFDGVCNLCNASVDLIVRNDPKSRLRFASLQSDVGHRLMPGRDPNADPESSVLIEGGRTYTRSTAALKIARLMTFPWPLLYVFIVVPRPIRDLVYDWIATNRYKWFGKKDSCRLPAAEEQARFL